MQSTAVILKQSLISGFFLLIVNHLIYSNCIIKIDNFFTTLKQNKNILTFKEVITTVLVIADSLSVAVDNILTKQIELSLFLLLSPISDLKECGRVADII